MINRRDFNKLLTGAGLYAALSPEKALGQSPEAVQKSSTPEKKKPPELRSTMSQEEGEKELLLMAKQGIGKLRTTAFISTRESKRWVITDTQENIKPLFQSVDNGTLEGKGDIVIYRIGAESMEIAGSGGSPNQTKSRTELQPSIVPVQKLIDYLPNVALYADAGKDWHKSELLNVLYLSKKLRSATVSGKIATPYGFARFTVDERMDHWAQFSAVFEETENIITYLKAEYPDTLGSEIARLTKGMGTDTPNIVSKFLSDKKLAITSARIQREKINPGTGDVDQGLYVDLDTQHTRLKELHDIAILGKSDKETKKQLLSGYGEVKEAADRAIIEARDQAVERSTENTLRDIQRAYAIIGVDLEFELTPGALKNSSK